MNAVQRKTEELRTQCQEIAHALLCVGPADLSITSKKRRIHSDLSMAHYEEWMRDELALHSVREGLLILTRPEFVLDRDEQGFRTFTVLAVTIPWSALQRTGQPGVSG